MTVRFQLRRKKQMQTFIVQGVKIRTNVVSAHKPVKQTDTHDNQQKHDNAVHRSQNLNSGAY